jgi:hypothetical protein
MEGDGNTDKGAKLEWSTVKDGILYLGSFGKEYVNKGKITGQKALWVTMIDAQRRVLHVDWTRQYTGELRIDCCHYIITAALSPSCHMYRTTTPRSPSLSPPPLPSPPYHSHAQSLRGRVPWLSNPRGRCMERGAQAVGLPTSAGQRHCILARGRRETRVSDGLHPHPPRHHRPHRRPGPRAGPVADAAPPTE